MQSLDLLTRNAAQWTVERSAAWAKQHPWRAGCNYCTSTACNQIEMWNASTFDMDTIKKEMSYMNALGFSVCRVFLHDICWKDDAIGCMTRIDQFLTTAASHNIMTMLVFFDSCWDPCPRAGPQSPPVPFVHNSRWVQSPGEAILGDDSKCETLKSYVQGILTKFKNDNRILCWDLFNEPDSPPGTYKRSYPSSLPNKSSCALNLLMKAFRWAREINPSQPLTSATWMTNDNTLMNLYQNTHSDIISFHSYLPPDNVEARVSVLKSYQRPIICSEYMCRPVSTFNPILNYFKNNNIACMSWGFVNGKLQTVMPWDSWQFDYKEIPKVWFHDVLNADGTPFSVDEQTYIQSVIDGEGWHVVTDDDHKNE